MKRISIAALAACLLLTGSGIAQAHSGGIHPRDLHDLRAATARYHTLSQALADGYVPFSLDPANPDEPTCFDSADGGMGVHYVRNIDDILDATDPEALVYEIDAHGKLKLVAVEYIIPAGFVDPANPPELFGHALHAHSFLPVWILHVWVWQANPDGILADFNPNVAACPN